MKSRTVALSAKNSSIKFYTRFRYFLLLSETHLKIEKTEKFLKGKDENKTKIYECTENKIKVTCAKP